MAYDPSLPRLIYRETVEGQFEIYAILNGFGGLTVMVEDLAADPEIDKARHPWQGDNVLAAREWIRSL